MPPAGAKRGSAKKSSNTNQPYNKNWEAGLVKEQFNEDSWQACVSLVVGDHPEEEKELIQPLVSALQQPQRKLFTLITWDDTLAKIHELGNPKAKKPDDLPMFYEVTEPAKALLDAGEEIPCDLMAKILKFQLLQVKTYDLQRRETERMKNEGQKEKVLPRSDSKVKLSDKKGKAPPPALETSKEKKTKLRRRDDVESPVYLDDEPDDDPQHYILLVGLHQPLLIRELDAVDVHVANVIKLCYKRQESLPDNVEHRSQEEAAQSLQALPGLAAGVAVNARKLELFWSQLRSGLDGGPPDSKLHDVIQLSYTVSDLSLPIQTQDPQSRLDLGNRIFDDVSRLIYHTLEWRRQYQHYQDNVQLICIPTAVTLDSQPAEVVPTAFQSPLSKRRPAKDHSPATLEITQPPLSVSVDMCYYNSLLDLVPPDVCSVPLILHCLLEQVVISADQAVATLSHVPKDQNPEPGPWLDPDLVNFTLQSFLPLLSTEEEKRHLLTQVLTMVQKEEDKKRLLEEFGTERAQKKAAHPLVIRHHDESARRLQDVIAVHGFNPAKVESSMMRSCPVWKLISAAKPRNSDTCWKAVKQQLQHYCTDESILWPEAERLFHQSVFEAMSLTVVDQQGVLFKDAELELTRKAIPWDNPLLYAKQKLQTRQTQDPTFLTEDPGDTEDMSEKGCRQLDLSEIQNCRQRNLFDWCYTEHHDTAVFPQVLKVASEEYCCLDIFRGSYRDILYVFCHNPMNSLLQSKQSWDVALHTDVKFRKYLEHVADKISSWTTEEELKREEAQIRSQIPAEAPKDESPEIPTEKEEVLEPVIRKDSLKAWKLEQEQQKKDETTKKSKKENTPRGKQKKEEVQTSDKKSKALSGDKKSRPDKGGGSAKTPAGPDGTPAPAEDETRDPHRTQEPDKRFIGYIMDGQLIHASGCVQNIYPSDGGRVTVENMSLAEGSTSVNVAVKKDGHHFYTHVVHNQQNLPQDKKNCNVVKEEWKEPEAKLMNAGKLGSFSAVLSNQIHLSYSFYGPSGEFKETFEDAEVAVSSSNLDSMKQIQSSHAGLNTNTSKPVCRGQPAQSSPPFNGLSLSVPNGLLLQFLHEDTQGASPKRDILVRQSFNLHTKGPGHHLQDFSLSKELHRIVTSQGAVIRHMRDGSTEILFADGSVSFSPDSGPVSEVEEDGEQKDQTSDKEAEGRKRIWQTTSSSGDRFCTIGKANRAAPGPSVRTFKATDPITHQVMLSREDLVVIVQNPDGSRIVEHADGTRITSLLVTPANGEASDFVTKSTERGNIKDACDKGEGKGRNVSPICNERILNSASDGQESPKERFVLVEREGCASVAMYPDRHAARLFLADGTLITANNKAEYEVLPSGRGFLHIRSDGRCLYSSDLEPNACSPTDQPGVYFMSHTDEVACEVTDNNGHHFQIMKDGQIVVLNASPTPGIQAQKEEQETEGAMAALHAKHKPLCPRLFLVHEDGSGTELLNSLTVDELLNESYSDPSIALLNEPLPDKQEEFAITILKPSHHSVWSKWLLEKQNPDFTPPSLKNRNWMDFPTREDKTPGPPIGSDVGVGLTLKERFCGSAAQQQRVRSCPKVLEIRELYQQRHFTTTLRHTLDLRLKEYIESLMKKELQSEERKLKEPRSEEEAARAAHLFSLILSFAEEQDVSHASDAGISGGTNNSAPADYASLYDKGVGASAQQSDGLHTDMDATGCLDRLPLHTNRKHSTWTPRLDQHRQEISEEKAYKEALRKKIVVPYFHPENLSIYQSLFQNPIPKTRRRSQDVPLITKSESFEGYRKVASNQNTPHLLNATPSQSQSRAAERERIPERRHPNLASNSAGESSMRNLSRQRRPLKVDMTRRPRRTKVRLPTCLLDSKPCHVPNRYLLTVEEPVRRKSRTASLPDPSAMLRGFQLYPSAVDFGSLREGTCSTVTVLMKNVGVDPCRFNVKQPPPATGLRVIYNRGPVAAGLQAKVKVQLFAMCDETEPKTYISQDITILTEADILYLPVTAVILSERFYKEASRSADRKKGFEAICSQGWPGSRIDKPSAP